MFFFQFFNDKIHNYVLFSITVHFNIQKLKNKHTFIQTERAKSSHFDRTRGFKNQIFPTIIATQKFFIFFCFVILAGAKIKTSHPLVPPHNAATHGQPKQKLKSL